MSCIKVAVRCRPLFQQERAATGLDIQGRRILLDAKTYDPDFTFPPSSSQDDVFAACHPILQCVKDGVNGTVMVYGQTGTGKTYTMLGSDGRENGLVHKVIGHMLEHVQQKTLDGAQCALTLSMVEIYNERITDMLSPSGDEEVTLISGFPRFTHKSTLCRLSDAKNIIETGLAWRHTATTMMNERSSRSHVVFILDVEEYNAFTEQTDVAHLFMVDLAGSESLKKSQASGTTAGEAGKINRSLLALKSVFLALSNTNEATRPGHVPYRDSKLTELLQDSIGGTARTLMVACISSVGRDIEETKSTLMYAVKARSIRNAANTEREKLLVRLRSMEVENQKLRNRLQERVSERGGYYIGKEEHEQYTAMEEEVKSLKEAVEELMKDRQNSDARQHISESQTKVLQGLLEDKDAELQGMKEVYYDALKRFESQLGALQRSVRNGVLGAKAAVQASFAGNYERLYEWRSQALMQLDGQALSPCTAPEDRHGNEEEAVLEDPPRRTTPPPSVSAAPVATSLSSPPPSPQRSTNRLAASIHRSSVAQSQRLSCSSSVSPTRRGGGRPHQGFSNGGPKKNNGLSSSSQAMSSHAAAMARSSITRDLSSQDGPFLPSAPLFPAKETLPSEAGRISPKHPCLAAQLAVQDAECQRVICRINDTVQELIDDLIRAFSDYTSQIQQVEGVRRKQQEAILHRLQLELTSSLTSLRRAEETALRDATTACQTFQGQLSLKKKMPPVADTTAVQQSLRNICRDTIGQMSQAFPSPATPADTDVLFDQILLQAQHTTSGFTVAALAPLSSNDVSARLTALLPGTAAGSPPMFSTASPTMAAVGPGSPMLLDSSSGSEAILPFAAAIASQDSTAVFAREDGIEVVSSQLSSRVSAPRGSGSTLSSLLPNRQGADRPPVKRQRNTSVLSTEVPQRRGLPRRSAR